MSAFLVLCHFTLVVSPRFGRMVALVKKTARQGSAEDFRRPNRLEVERVEREDDASGDALEREPTRR